MEEGLTRTDAWSRRLVSGWFYWPACLAGTLLVGLAVFGPEAERRLAVEGQCAAMEAEVKALQESRDQLAAAEKALQDDPNYTESQVRLELGIVRPGEIRLPHPVRLQPPPPAAPAPDACPSPVLRTLSLFADSKFRFVALVVGAALLAAGILFSLPPKRQVQG